MSQLGSQDTAHRQAEGGTWGQAPGQSYRTQPEPWAPGRPPSVPFLLAPGWLPPEGKQQDKARGLQREGGAPCSALGHGSDGRPMTKCPVCGTFPPGGSFWGSVDSLR